MKLRDDEIKEQLRELSKNIDKRDKVLLPDVHPQFLFDSPTDAEFVNIPLAELLYFIADMI